MKIDSAGQVTLSNGFIFNGDLTQSEFEAQKLHDPARVRNPGTPWFYFPFADSQISGHDFHVIPCFYSERLVSLELYVDLNQGSSGWNDFSHEIEEKKQLLYAQLLQQWLGYPHKVIRRNLDLKQYPALVTYLTYGFAWGEIGCGFEERSGYTSAIARYTKNDKWAREDYARRQKSHL